MTQFPKNEMTFRMAGSCGELVQGLVDGREVLISYPINLYNQLTIRRRGCPINYGAEGRDSGSTTGRSADCGRDATARERISRQSEGMHWTELSRKMQQGIRLVLDYFSLDVDCLDQLEWIHQVEIPVGMGMASSTVDLALVCGGLVHFCGFALSPMELAQLLVQVEPTDSIIFPEATLFDQNQGRFAQKIAPYPKMKVLVLGMGYKIDTQEFRQYRLSVPAVEPMVTQVVEGLTTGNFSLLGRGAINSALIWQEILSKPDLKLIIEMALLLECYGINVAHSGTVVGILYDPNLVSMEKIYLNLQRLGVLKDYPLIWDLQMVGGGLEVLVDGEFIPLRKGG